MPEVALTHRHRDGTSERLVAEDERRVDHLRVVRYGCSCGVSHILLTSIPRSRAGRSSPAAALRLVK